VDFFILESQESFRTGDNGKEFILLMDKFPDYSKRKNLKITKAQMFKERSEKLKDNQDYNKDDKKTADSLNTYYRELELEIGNTITWWEPVRQATSKDSKKTTAKKESGLKSLIKETVNPNQTQQQTKTVKESNNDTTKVENGIFYVKMTRQVRGDLPLFYVLDKQSTVRFGGIFETDTYECPIGVKPIFDISEYKNSIFVLRNESQGNYDFDWKQLDFIVDDKVKISVRNFKIDQGEYKPKIDKSIEILYDKKKLQKIDEFLNSLKSKNLVIVADGEEFTNPALNNLTFNPANNELKINFTNNGGTLEKSFKGVEDANYRYDRSYPNKRAKIIFSHLPIYYTDCYNEQIKAFSNLTLRGDAINNPSLKQTLDKAMSSSTDWRNYKIELK